MNYINAQKQIFNNIVKGDRVCGYWIDDDRFFVTGDRYHGFIFPKETIAFDVNRVNTINELFNFNDAVEENEIKETNGFKLIYKIMYRVFKRKDGKPVLINVGFLKHFQNAKYYQVNALDAVMIVENIRNKSFPVGVALPIRYRDDDDEWRA